MTVRLTSLAEEDAGGTLSSRRTGTGGSASVAGVAVGAMAIGRLAIRKTLAGKAKFKSLEIAELTVTRPRVSDIRVSDALRLPPNAQRENRESE
jgi:hypothetical protein